MEDPMASHPDEMLVEGPAGSLVVFNGYTWHSGTRNTTEIPRRGIFSTFGRRDQPWEEGPQSAMVDDASRERLGSSALYVLDALAAPDLLATTPVGVGAGS
jgi:ectoine hydroxylase-related dioxygenase (phytanoyl-CoA dioxygenase family)